MVFTIPDLPFGYDSLIPHMSRQTLEFHHDKHHQTYATNLNKLADGTPYADQTLVQIMQATVGDAGKKGIFNNAAQVWNHSFFWNSLSPHGTNTPSGALAVAIDTAFGSLNGFKDQFKAAGAGQFGSGWAWLVKNSSGAIEIVTTGNADCPLTDGKTPLVTCDVWEHAYYLDYQNRRPDFLTVFVDQLINWDFAVKNFESA